MNSYRMATLDDVENGVSEIQSIACRIKSLGGLIDDNAIESAIFRALPRSFAPFITMWSFRESDKRTLESLHSHLMQNVSMLRSNDEKSDKALSAKGQRNNKGRTNNNKNKNSSESKDSDSVKKFCKYCRKSGHLVDECRKLARKKSKESNDSDQKPGPSKLNSNTPDKKEDKQDKPPAADDTQSTSRVAYGYGATAVALMSAKRASSNPSSSKFVDSYWFADSGASFHMTNQLELISGYRELNEPLDVALGDSYIVKAIGTGFLETTYGVIESVFYVPKINHNLFSTSYCAIHKKIYSLTTDKSMIFYKNNKELFRANIAPCGLFEIKFTTKRAQFASLLSTSLSNWHEIVAHVSSI